MTTTEQTQSDVQETILQYTNDARDNLEAEREIRRINGACHRNVVFLADYFLEHTDYQPYIRWGAVGSQNRSYETVEAAEEDDAVHFWVELDTEYGWLNADIFSMASHNDGLPRGEVFASYGLPTNYYQPEDSLFEYDPSVITPNLLLSDLDYEMLKGVIEPTN